MKRLIILTLFFQWMACSPNGERDHHLEVDVCIYGGTAAGVMAAYSAKKMGKSVLLIEPGKYLGGMTTGGLGWTDFGNKEAVSGLALDFYRTVGKYYGKEEEWRFAPSVAANALQEYVEEADLDILFQKRIVGAEKNGTELHAILLEDSFNNAENNLSVKAKVFLDCTYEGDLFPHAQVSYHVGRESSDTYGESLNGVQLYPEELPDDIDSIKVNYFSRPPVNRHQFPDGVDPYVEKGNPESGLLWGISDEELAPNGSGDDKVQAYNFRVCLAKDKENQAPITKPENYDSDRYELLLRLIEVQQSTDIDDYLLIRWTMPDGIIDVNNKGGFSTDMIGMNYEYPEADYETRARIWKAHEDYTKGLLYFLGHDERVPKELRDQMLALGYCKDEFTDNDNFPHQLYVREGRRLIGEYVMTQNNCVGDEVVDDQIGLAAYGMDSHHIQRIVVDGNVKNEGDIQVHGFDPYPIAYRAITPKREECTNLLVPVSLSSSHIAFGSIRMEPVFMVLAQSAAVAASLAIDEGVMVQEVSVDRVQTILQNDPLLENRGSK
ncbi:FAD-dependent oxidoreductase [Pleomorphovibrio marinus]|uniref:FAD-dependent oxidoreductase n=1 Tax=Pleomorphovibrio marinus TaxID=2164132 RepID=UPI000E09F333|nr:FAD-dependent oxidoreductase [Pleomorphovibrio marinus]